MGCRQLIVLSFVLACVSFSDARHYGSGVPGRRGSGVHKSAEAERKQPSRFQIKQTQETLPPLSWRFPEEPMSPLKELPVEFSRPLPVESDRLAVRCGENKVFVEVSQDLTGVGKLIKPEDLTLGGCSATEIDESAHVLVFESDLHSCNSTLVMTDDVFIYAFVLLYNPRLGRSLITRSQRAAIGVECHYKRKSSASAGPLKSRNKPVREHPYFSLKLKNDDWSSERSSNRYTLADVMNMEVTVMQSEYAPLQVLVDHCVAAKKPGFTSEHKQEFIKNHGCLGGRYSGSRFLPQSRPETLQFQVEASSFHPLNLLFISCYVKAIPASSPATIENKACSFFEGRWRAVHGNDQFCSCCGSTCGMRKARDLDSDVKWDAELVVGPLIIQ